MNKGTRLIVFVVLAALLLSPMAALAQDGDEEVTIRMTWWGNDARHEKYNTLLDLYEELNPNITVEREFTGWGGYWDKLATQVAADSAPDLIIMHLNFVNDYASRGALVELTPYMESGQIDLSNFTKGALEAGKVGDELYMITLGLTPRALFYNPRLFEDAGVPMPEDGWTWEDFKEDAIAITGALEDESVYGVADQGGQELAFMIFLGQRGKRMFEGNELGFEKQDLIDWWSFWEELREAEAIPPADVSIEEEDAPHADHMLTHGRIAMFISPGNQFKLYQEYAEDELEMVDIPDEVGEDAVPYNFAGGAFMSIYEGSEHKDAVADLINWFVNDPEVAVIYNGEHGPPGSTEMQDVLMPNLDPADQKLYAFYAKVADFLKPQPPQPAQGGEVIAAYMRIYQDVMFGNMSVEEAVDFFFDEADFILG